MHTIHALSHTKLLASITAREQQLLILASEGHCDSSIAKDLGISRGTVLSLWARLRAKIGQQTRVPAIAGMISGVSRLVERSLMLAGEGMESSTAGLVLVSRHGVVLAANAFATTSMGCRLGHMLDHVLDRTTWPDHRLIFGGEDLETRLYWPICLLHDRTPSRRRFSAFVVLLDDPCIGKSAMIRFRLDQTNACSSSAVIEVPNNGDEARLPRSTSTRSA